MLLIAKGNTLTIQNHTDKTIQSYRLACVRTKAHLKVMHHFPIEKNTIAPSKGLMMAWFDAPPDEKYLCQNAMPNSLCLRDNISGRHNVASLRHFTPFIPSAQPLTKQQTAQPILSFFQHPIPSSEPSGSLPQNLILSSIECIRDPAGKKSGSLKTLNPILGNSEADLLAFHIRFMASMELHSAPLSIPLVQLRAAHNP